MGLKDVLSLNKKPNVDNGVINFEDQGKLLEKLVELLTKSIDVNEKRNTLLNKIADSMDEVRNLLKRNADPMDEVKNSQKILADPMKKIAEQGQYKLVNEERVTNIKVNPQIGGISSVKDNVSNNETTTPKSITISEGQKWLGNDPWKNYDFKLTLNSDMLEKIQSMDVLDDEVIKREIATYTPKDFALVEAEGIPDYIAKKSSEGVVYVLPARPKYNKGDMAQSGCYKFYDFVYNLESCDGKVIKAIDLAEFEQIDKEFILKKKGLLGVKY